MSLYPASFDDNDPAIIYSGSGWELVTEDGEWRGTMHSTSVTGSWARVRFTGSRIAVICTIPTGDGSLSQARFQIDDGPIRYSAHRTTPPVQWQTTFWDSGPLPMGSHLLTITNAGNEAYFRMDRIDYDPTDSNAPRQSSSAPAVTRTTVTQRPTVTVETSRPVVNSTATTSTSSSSPSQASRVSASTTTTGSTSAVAAPSTATNTNNTTTQGLPVNPSSDVGGRLGPDSINASAGDSVPKILAGIFGAILGLVIVAAVIFFLRKKQRRRNKVESFLLQEDDLHQSRTPVSVTPVPFLANWSRPWSDSDASLSQLQNLEESISQSSPLLPLSIPVRSDKSQSSAALAPLRSAPPPLAKSKSQSTLHSLSTDDLHVADPFSDPPNGRIPSSVQRPESQFTLQYGGPPPEYYPASPSFPR